MSYDKEYYDRNKDKILKCGKDWRKKNRKRWNKTIQANRARRKKENPQKYKEQQQRAKEKYLYGRLREVILKRDNYTCQSCGKKENLQIHHIDGCGSGSKAKEKNNKLENLITLCSNCHSKVHVIMQDRERRESGMWSSKFKKCISCGKTDCKHVSRGLCNRCYQLTRKKYKREFNKRYCKNT